MIEGSRFFYCISVSFLFLCNVKRLESSLHRTFSVEFHCMSWIPHPFPRRIYLVPPCQSVRAGGRSYADVINKFSRFNRFPLSIQPPVGFVFVRHTLQDVCGEATRYSHSVDMNGFHSNNSFLLSIHFQYTIRKNAGPRGCGKGKECMQITMMGRRKTFLFTADMNHSGGGRTKRCLNRFSLDNIPTQYQRSAN